MSKSNLAVLDAKDLLDEPQAVLTEVVDPLDLSTARFFNQQAKVCMVQAVAWMIMTGLELLEKEKAMKSARKKANAQKTATNGSFLEKVQPFYDWLGENEKTLGFSSKTASRYIRCAKHARGLLAQRKTLLSLMNTPANELNELELKTLMDAISEVCPYQEVSEMYLDLGIVSKGKKPEVALKEEIRGYSGEVFLDEFNAAAPMLPGIDWYAKAKREIVEPIKLISHAWHTSNRLDDDTRIELWNYVELEEAEGIKAVAEQLLIDSKKRIESIKKGKK